jgi:hypothetical protein
MLWYCKLHAVNDFLLFKKGSKSDKNLYRK